MGEAFGQMLPIAIAIAASPPPIIVAVLMLVSARPRANGLAYALGWITGIAALGTLVLALAGTADASDDDGDPSTWVSLLQLAFGVVLLVLAPGSGEAGRRPATTFRCPHGWARCTHSRRSRQPRSVSG